MVAISVNVGNSTIIVESAFSIVRGAPAGSRLDIRGLRAA